jgi:hypothetical protein
MTTYRWRPGGGRSLVQQRRDVATVAPTTTTSPSTVCLNECSKCPGRHVSAEDQFLGCRREQIIPCARWQIRPPRASVFTGERQLKGGGAQTRRRARPPLSTSTSVGVCGVAIDSLAATPQRGPLVARIRPTRTSGRGSRRRASRGSFRPPGGTLRRPPRRPLQRLAPTSGRSSTRPLASRYGDGVQFASRRSRREKGDASMAWRCARRDMVRTAAEALSHQRTIK